MTLAEKFTRLKTSVGGNREKMHFEDTFGMPKEEQAHITRPGRANARILAELEFALHLSEAENGKYDAALEEALDYLLEKQQTEGVLTDQACEEAEEILEPIAEEAKSYELILAAHAHIDMNWMWSFNETVSIVLATFRSILNIMDQYPEFCFSQSQASVYKIVEEYDPELMERIKARIAEGRWEVTASAWVETDKNMPSGESLLRHIQYTREYLSKVWGVKDFDLDFSPDTFGHSANVPEIDQFGGVKYFYHCRGNARRDVLYRYQAPSGKEVLTYREPNWYNGAITPQIGAGFMEIVKKSSGLKTGLVVYGVGDHGGGPTRRDVERALEMQTWKIYPKIRFGTFRDYFHEAEKNPGKAACCKRRIKLLCKRLLHHPEPHQERQSPFGGCVLRCRSDERTGWTEGWLPVCEGKADQGMGGCIIYPFPRHPDRLLRTGFQRACNGTVPDLYGNCQHPDHKRNARDRRKDRYILDSGRYRCIQQPV